MSSDADRGERIVVRAQGLRFAYGAAPVIDGLDLTLAAGEVFGIVGPDGAGKSTLLRLLLGQLVPVAGTVEVLGHKATDPSLRQQLAYMPQDFGQYPDLSVGENLGFFADLHGLPRSDARSRIEDLLRRTGLAPFRQRRAGQLSGGMMQKLALACALVNRPQVMFLDEPTTGVDPISRRAIWQLLDQVRTEGVAIVLSTVNMEEAARCDRVGLLMRARLQRQGTPLELVRWATAPLYELHSPGVRARRAELRGWPQVALVFPVGETLKVWLVDSSGEGAFRAAVAAMRPPPKVRRVQPSLHDVALRDLELAHVETNERSGD